MFWIIILMMIAVLAACGGNNTPSPTDLSAVASPTLLPSETPTHTPTRTPTTTNTPKPSATPTQTPSPAPTATPKPTDTPTATPRPTLPPNEMGQVLVLEYHRIGEPEERWQRTPDNFRQDMAYLYQNGYIPANIIDLARGFPHVPAGKKPVVLTFDDSYAGQFRYLDDGAIDPDSAVGMLLAMHEKYSNEWPLKGTFYVLPDALFGQRALADQKLQWLVNNGFEVASHTLTHFNLGQGSDDEVQWELAMSQRQLEARLPGYTVESLSVPYGAYPLNESLVAAGTWEGEPYTYSNVVMVGGGAGPSPHSSDFNPYYIRRTQAIQTELDYWLTYFAENPGQYYVSAGPEEK